MQNIFSTQFHQKLSYWQNQTLPEKGKPYTDPLFPPNINSLISKNENNEYNDKIKGPEQAKKININDIIWLRASEIFKNQTYQLFESEIKINDIIQGSLGDCYFSSSLASLTKYPNLIYQMFKTKKINQEGFFEIILFIDGFFQIVIVDDFLPFSKTKKEICFSKPNNNGIWVCILEKAWAKINGGYSNIIKGWMHHALKTFTGFPSKSFNHSIIKFNDLWNKIFEAKQQNFIITCSTKNNVSNVGLINSHAYSVIDCIVINSKGKKVNLIKIRNSWGYQKWNGDWSNKSSLWGDEEKKQVGFKDKNDGMFYISFEDFYKYFKITTICYVLYNSFSKSYVISGENKINNGNVFNLFFEEDGYLAISLIRKMWRFHRELSGSIIPSYLGIIKYEPSLNITDNNYFKGYDGVYESYEDLSLIKYLKKGFYLIYSYHDLENSTIKNDDNYIIKFDSPVKFKHKEVSIDLKKDGFPLLKNIIIRSIIQSNENNIKNKIDLSYSTKFRKDGLGHRLVYNNDNNRWLKYKEDVTEMNNMFILSPFNKNNSVFEWYIPPKDFNIIIGMCIDSKIPYSLNLQAKFCLTNSKPKVYNNYKKLNIKNYANDIVLNENQNNKDSYYDFVTLPLDKAEKNIKFKKINLSKISKNNVRKQYPNIINILENFYTNENEFNWIISEEENIIYVGQVNVAKKKEGKGAYIYKNSDHIKFGIFNEGKINGQGIIYNKELNKILYNGNFLYGKKSGKGILYLDNGDRYEGEFKNDKKQGKGIYYFSSKYGEQKWEGNFEKGFMDGEGIFTDFKGNEIKIEYKNGKIVK